MRDAMSDNEQGSVFKGLVIAVPIGIAMWLGLWYAFKWLFL